MPIPSYTQGYPPDGSSLGQTKAVIRNNLDGTFETLAVDHVNNNGQPGSQPAGYHTIIHQVPQSSVSSVAGYNQVFSGVPGTLVVNGVTTSAIPGNGDQQLYSLTGGGALSQLTGNLSAGNGYVWIGGLLLQWGKRALTGSSTEIGSITFGAGTAVNNVPFPNNLFNVQMTLICTPTDGKPLTGSIALEDFSESATIFGYQYTQGSGIVCPGFFWVAIGN